MVKVLWLLVIVGCGTDTETTREIVQVPGLNGTDCSVDEVDDGAVVTCGDNSVLVRHGDPGQDAPAKPCKGD